MCLVAHSRPILCKLVDWDPPGSSVRSDSPGKHTGVGGCALLPVIFPTQGSKPGLLGNFTSWVTGEAHLCIYLEKTVVSKNTCTPVCVAAPFAIAWTRKQLEWPSAEGGIKRMRYLCTVDYYSARKKNEAMLLTGMDLETVKVSEVSQKEKDRCVISLMWNLQKWYRWTCLQNRNSITEIGKKHDCQGRKDTWVHWEVGTDLYTLLCVKQTPEESLL